eukprot:TRINITY_DN36034_c0_g1_i1.p2 TRINITY_DN36034_c0_g1~~TRINITY_DN36034_c0_g1_i1.p2  ORF type:complete len:106 (-),score=26.78 TRINITY_DN36034_c0_g1_i1:225-542(-)
MLLKMRMMMVVLTVVMVLAGLGAGSPLPPACGQHQPEVSPSDCTYGITTNNCGHTVCLKGPGEMCGGKFGRYGTCADGLMCSNCNRCQGCSFRTFICWDDRNCIW